jgi:hypothetical protein
VAALVKIPVNIPAETITIISQVLFLTTDFKTSVYNKKYKSNPLIGQRFEVNMRKEEKE